MKMKNDNGFAAFGFSEDLLQKLAAQGLTQPTAVQLAVIGPLLGGRDGFIRAQTGSGKTLAFVLPLLADDAPGFKIVVAPTRELAQQIAEVIALFAVPERVALLCGGRDWEAQRQRIEDGADWLIGTPGRLLAHLRQGNIRADACRSLILDEADQLLEIGFLEEVGEIIARLAARRQTVLVSATLPQGVQDLADAGLKEPFVWQEKKRRISAAIKQNFISAGKEDKTNILCGLINRHCSGQGIVFCRTHWRAERLLQLLQQRGYVVALLHGKLTQRQREDAMQAFRDGMVQLLVATEVAARGLDIAAVSHVFNYDIPREPEAYLHRIGRTGRAGATGEAYTIFAAGEERYLAALKRTLGE